MDDPLYGFLYQAHRKLVENHIFLNKFICSHIIFCNEYSFQKKMHILNSDKCQNSTNECKRGKLGPFAKEWS